MNHIYIEQLPNINLE